MDPSWHVLRSTSLLLCLHILLLVGAPDALGLSYRMDVEKDLTFTTNASANSVRRQGIDSSLRKYSLMALSGATAGIVYNVTLPPYFDGITAQATWFNFTSSKNNILILNEFTIPLEDVVFDGPIVVIIYRRIFNFTVYSLPAEYDFAGPIVGVVAYASTNISFADASIPEANISSRITVHVPLSKNIGRRVPLCAFFGLDGTVTLHNISSLPNVCTSVNVSDVSLVLPATAAEAPRVFHPPTFPTPPPTSGMKRPLRKRKVSNSWKIALVATAGVVAGLILLVGLIICGRAVLEKVRIAVMRHFSASNEEPLQTSLIGQIRAPTAAGVRTRPTLEVQKFLAGTS